MNEVLLAIWLSQALPCASIYGKRLIEKYGSFGRIYELGAEGYLGVGMLPDTATMERLLDKNLAKATDILKVCEYNYFQAIEYTSNLYPQRLRAIKDPPPVLYARGRMIDFDDNVCIAVVGTRSYTDAGWNATYRVTSGLASGGAVVVTGLASGIDTAATRAALETSGYAVGVLGSGLERIYPSENRELFEQMYRQGLVVSEKAPFSEMSGKYFPVRNRLISGLCNGVLMCEGSTKSGAMHTVAHGSEQGRHIYAIPGDISSEESTGVNRLIREGAMPVFDAKDVLDKYMYFYPHRIGLNPISTAAVEVPEARSTKRVRVVRGQGKTAAAKNSGNDSDKSYTQTSANVQKGLDKIKSVAAQNGKSRPKKVPVQGKASTNIKFEMAFEGNLDKLEARMKRTDEEIWGKNGEKLRTQRTSSENVSKKEDATLSLLGDEEKKIYDLICRKGTVVVDSICDETGIDLPEVNAVLTALEMFGYIETSGPNIRKKT